MTIAVMAFSFGLRKKEPGPCNIRIAEIVKRIVEELERAGCAVITIAQWEIAMALNELGTPVAHVVYPVPEDRYFNSRDVVDDGAKYLRSRGDVEFVIPVAQRGLHLLLCRRLIKEFGFKVFDEPIDKIGFDKESVHWWARGPIRLLLYAVLKFFGYAGKQPPKWMDEQWKRYRAQRESAGK